MNIHTQARLLVKYELETPGSLRDRAITKTELKDCRLATIWGNLAQIGVELQIGTQLLY